MLLVGTAALACTSRPGGDPTDAAADSGTDATSSTSDEGADASSEGSSTTVGLETSTTEPSGPVCGDGVVDPGEECDDDAAGCVDCMFACGLGPAVAIALTSPTWATITPPPVAIADGSGDFLVTSANNVHRMTAAGHEVWVSGGDPTDDWTYAVGVAGDALWAIWTIGGEAPFLARLTRHSPDDGDVIATIDLLGNPSSGSGNVYGTPDGDLMVVYSSDTDATDMRPVIERRTADGASILWSSSIAGMPGVDGVRTEWADFLGLADDGATFVGVSRVDGPVSHPLVAKLDADGTELWQTLVYVDDAPNFSGRVEQPSPLADGGVAVIAWRQFTKAHAVGFFPQLDTRAVRLDADGEVLWETDLADQIDSGRVQLFAIRSLAPDRLLVAGTKLAAGHADTWLGYLDGDGNLLCSTTVPDASGYATTIAGIFTDATGALMVHGFAEADAESGWADVRWMAPLGP